MNELCLKLHQEAINQNTSPERLVELSNIGNSFITLLVAENVNTSPETLTQLADSKIQAIRKAVVRNPNTSTKVLIKLGAEFPQELSKNPIISLWLLEDINPLLPIYDELNGQVYKHQEFYPYINALREIASSNLISISLLQILLQVPDVSVRVAVTNNLNTPTNLLEQLVVAAGSSHRLRKALAENPQTPVGILKRLANDCDWRIRAKVATNPQTPISILERLATDYNSRVRAKVTNNPQFVNLKQNALNKSKVREYI